MTSGYSGYSNKYIIASKKRKFNLRNVSLYYFISVTILILYSTVVIITEHKMNWGLAFYIFPIGINLVFISKDIKERLGMKKEGLQFCSFCKGRRLVRTESKTLKFWKIPTNICPKCNGLGKIDWVRNVINTG
jgi:hypothetical protein